MQKIKVFQLHQFPEVENTRSTFMLLLLLSLSLPPMTCRGAQRPLVPGEVFYGSCTPAHTRVHITLRLKKQVFPTTLKTKKVF